MHIVHDVLVELHDRVVGHVRHCIGKPKEIHIFIIVVVVSSSHLSTAAAYAALRILITLVICSVLEDGSTNEGGESTHSTNDRSTFEGSCGQKGGWQRPHYCRHFASRQ